MEQEKEIWVKVKGYEDSHEVSNLGRIKGINRNVCIWGGNTRIVKERILKQGNSGRNKQYKRVQFKHKERHFSVHRVVYDSFHGLITGMEINHIDGNPSNNRLDNLEQVTASENVIHAYMVLGRVGARTGHFGAKSKNNKPVLQYDLNGNFIKRYDCVISAIKETNIFHISSCALGKRETAGGYKWKHELLTRK